jgi:hypothetical protein
MSSRHHAIEIPFRFITVGCRLNLAGDRGGKVRLRLLDAFAGLPLLEAQRGLALPHITLVPFGAVGVVGLVGGEFGRSDHGEQLPLGDGVTLLDQQLANLSTHLR